jgi:phosphate acetyltransferase
MSQSGTTSVYIAGTDTASGKTMIGLAILQVLSRLVATVTVFRPVVRAGRANAVVQTLLSRSSPGFSYDDCVGVSYDDVHANPDRALEQIMARYRSLASRCDAVVIVGTDYTGVGAPTEFAFNARVASNLGTPMLLVVTGLGRSVSEISAAVEVARAELAAAHVAELAIVVNRAADDLVEPIRKALDDLSVPAFVLPEVPSLSAPTMGDLMAACDGQLLFGDRLLLRREIGRLVVAAMPFPQVLDKLAEGAAVIASVDQAGELLPGLIAAHESATFPYLSGVILNGEMELPASLRRLIDGLDITLPVILTRRATFETAVSLSAVTGSLAQGAEAKIDTACGVFTDAVDQRVLLERLHVARATCVTPLMFEQDLLERARADRRHIVLPEGTDERILRAADILLRRGVVDLTLLGAEDVVRNTAARLALDISAANVIDPQDAAAREPLAAEFARLRAGKGVTLEAARDVLTDVSYFGTLMVQLRHADGMVSGAAHTTTHTIRPAFEVIKTAPGTALVSSAFLMCLADRVLVYADCAVNPNPDAEQLADIAISSAATAAQFAVEPRVAMLSYSTGNSGSGADVEKVRQAVLLVRQRRPDLPVEGPIQYDAAVDPAVARAKMPDSPVAGRATVFIVPDLNTGNTLYKAVQRSAGAVAIGPVLQGLRRPVNDLSRGATVHDIVNTVAITAIQAQGDDG